jgi:hypothetical protein
MINQPIRPPKKTTKTVKMPTLNLPKEETPLQTEPPKEYSAIPSAIDVENIWQKIADVQKSATIKETIPIRIMLFGTRWTGKTHDAEDACNQPAVETDKFRFNSFKPARVIDCGHGAKTIALKDFPEQYKKGDLIVIQPFISDDGKLIEDPIERFGRVRTLVRSCSNFVDGCVIIDEFDRIENDARYFIYRQYGIYEKENGELWYHEKVKYEERKKIVVPESRVGGIIPRMYGPRNEHMRTLMKDILMLRIPVILIAHEEAEYDKKTEEVTGKIISTAQTFVEDDMDLMIHLENVEITKSEKKGGGTNLVVELMRRATFRKNRFAPKGTSDILVVERKNFEFSDLFSIMLNGDTNG